MRREAYRERLFIVNFLGLHKRSIAGVRCPCQGKANEEIALRRYPMAVAVTMSSKNQIVVPSEACEKLHLAPGAKLPVIAKLSTPRVLPCSERLSVCRMREIRTYGLMRRSRETCSLLYR